MVKASATIPPPTYDVEQELIAAGARVVAGLDEVGRGAWAGPVLVCAAITDGSPPPEGLTDSKRLTPRRRTAMAEQVRSWVRGYAFGQASPAEIDRLGMTEALRLAAHRALDALPVRPDAVIVDGKHDYVGAPWTVRTHVKADLTCVSVAAASVLAKVHRDALMAELDAEYPGTVSLRERAPFAGPPRSAGRTRATPHHRLSWSYLDRLPRWRHLRVVRDSAVDGQLSLLD